MTRRSTKATSPSISRGSRSRRATTYRGYTVYKHGFGSQGPVLLQTLNMLEQFDLRAMGYASADYLHTIVEAMKLAYADRDSFYADPAFVKVPTEGLLSKAYAKERAALIDPRRASSAFVAGDPLRFDSQREGVAVLEGQVPGGGTTARASSTIRRLGRRSDRTRRAYQRTRRISPSWTRTAIFSTSRRAADGSRAR